MLKTLHGERADRVPADLAGLQFATGEAAAGVGDPLRRRLAERVLDQTHYFVTVPSHVNRYLVTPPQRINARGTLLPNGHRRTEGTIDTPKGELTYATEWDPVSNTAWTLKYPVETDADVEKIVSVPWELPADLAPPDAETAARVGDGRAIVATRISSPMVCVGGMMSYEAFLELCATRLELVLELTEICRRRVMSCLEVLLSRPGIEYVWIGGSEWVTPPMASPRIYDALVQEQERCMIDYVHRHARGAVVHIHCHGHVRRALERTIERGADYTEPVEPPPDGDVTMSEAKALAAGRITLGGNVECRVLCNESEDAVEQAVRDAFEGGKERFVLRPTEGPSPRLSEREFRNWTRMIDVWEEMSPIG